MKKPLYLFSLMMTSNEHYAFGQGLAVLDVLWMIGWFGLSCWFIADGAVTPEFRDAFRNVIFHNVNTGGLLYVLRFGPSKWGAAIPFLFALLADIEVGVALSVTLPSTHHAARVVAMVWAWVAVAFTVCSVVWFILAPRKEKSSRI